MKTKNTKRFTVFLIILAVAAWLFTTGFATEADKVSLSMQDASDNITFSVVNMFPGDRLTKDFTVKVSHQNPISLFYHADIRRGYEKLAEVLKINVYMPEKNIVIYDGLMRDMPNSLEYVLSAEEKEVVYRISVYLDTSVGNAYQNKHLVADFRWWYTEEKSDNNPEGSGGTGGGGIGDYVKPQSAYVKLAAEKLVDGEYPRGSKFSFVLSDEYGNEIQSVENKDGIIEFDTLEFDKKGEYIYRLQEKKGNDKDIIYDNSVYKVIVNIDKELNGYIAKVSYEKDDKEYLVLPRFINKTIPEELPETDKPGNSDKPISPEEADTPEKIEDSAEAFAPIGESKIEDDTQIYFPSNPKTGDDTDIMSDVYIFGASFAFAMLLLVFLICKKEKKHEE